MEEEFGSQFSLDHRFLSTKTAALDILRIGYLRDLLPAELVEVIGASAFAIAVG